MADKKKTESMDFYSEGEKTSGSGNDRNFIRDVLLGELKNFRSYLSSSWGGLGNSAGITGGNLFGFFTKQGFGAYYQSPNKIQSTVVNPAGTATGATPTEGNTGTDAGGNDFGTISVEKYNDGVSALPIGASSGAVKTPSWTFDLPQYSQKMLIKSTGPGLVYNTRTAAFTVGARLTGGTSGAQATIAASFNDGTSGTLYLTAFKTNSAGAVINFLDPSDAGGPELITDSSGGSATITRRTYNRTNAIQRIYGVGGENADSAGTIYTFWGLTDLYAPIGLFNLPTSLNGTARDVEQIPAFGAEGVMYIRNTAGTRALRIYLNGAWQTII